MPPIRTATVPANGVNAIRALEAGLGPGPFAGVLIFGDPTGLREPGLAEALGSAFGEATVIGCTTAGEVGAAGYLSKTLTAIAFSKQDYFVAAERVPLGDLRPSSMSSAVESLRHSLATHGRALSAKTCFAMLLTDGLSGCEEDVTYLAQAALGDVPLFGGSAGDGLRFDHTELLFDGALESNVAVVVVISSDRPFSVVRTQHFAPTATKFVVTGARAKERLVTELNGQPAAEAYAEAIGQTVEALTPSLFARHPLMIGAGGEWYVRSIQRVTEGNALSIFCSIEEGLVLTLGEGKNLVENLEDCLAAASRRVGTPQLVLGCDCILRRLEAYETGVFEPLAAVFERYRVIGFSTYGEQVGTMHVNQTFTGVALG